MYVVYDNAGTTFGVPKNFYKDVIALAPRYISHKKTLEAVLENMMLRKEGKERTTPQDLFEDVCDVLVRAAEEGRYKISGEGLIYPDTIERLKKDKEAGNKIALLTPGTPEYTRRFLDFQIADINFANYFDKILSGEDWGDKEDKATFIKLYENLNGQITSIFDDKLDVVRAALLASKSLGAPFDVFLVDRERKYFGNPEIKGIQKRFPNFNHIKTLEELK